MQSKNLFSLLLIGTVLLVLTGCSPGVAPENIETRNGVVYKINSDIPFSGTTVRKYENGWTKEEINYKNGKFHGELISYYENGQIKDKKNYLLKIKLHK